MIEYDPNRHWFRDLAHLGTSWTLRRITRAVLAVGVYSAVMSVIILWFNLEGSRLISGAFSLLGIILSIVLVFRTNTAYDRWWEGRKQWGTLVNNSRNLAIQIDACFPSDDRATRIAFARLIPNFAIALSGHLRNGVEESALIRPGPGEEHDPSNGNRVIAHRPGQIAHAIIMRIAEARRDGAIDGFDVLSMNPYTQALLDVAGACERIRKTPIPFSYNVFIKLFIIAYAAILPVGLVPEYKYLAIPLIMLIVFALLGLELMAEEIEDPFGLDCNDLPTEAIARTIRGDVADLLGVGTLAVVRAEEKVPYSKVF